MKETGTTEEKGKRALAGKSAGSIPQELRVFVSQPPEVPCGSALSVS